jgi:hypothetical protein
MRSLALLGLMIAAAAYLWWHYLDDDDDGGWDREEPDPSIEREMPASASHEDEPAWAVARDNGEREAVAAGGGPVIAGIGEHSVPRSVSFRAPWSGSPLPFSGPARPPA